MAAGADVPIEAKPAVPGGSNLRMAQGLAAALVLVVAAVVAGDGPAHASPPPDDPPLVDSGAAPTCCAHPRSFRPPTHFVTKLFRSVEEL